MNSSINIHEIVEKDLKGSVLIVGFPSVGLIGTIVANFLINTLKLEQIGIIDSSKFPSQWIWQLLQILFYQTLMKIQ